MSIFNTGDDQIDPDKKYYEDLVGEGKPFSDNEALARSKVEANLFIERLKQENEAMRKEMETRLKLEEVVNKITTATIQPQDRTEPPVKTEGQITSLDDVKKLVAEHTKQEQEKARQDANVKLVTETLIQEFGPNYGPKVKERAAALGVGEQFLNNLAATQPQAFLKLIEVEKRPVDVLSSPPRSTVQTQMTSSRTVERTEKYYDDLREKNPAEYFSPRVQNQMHKDALRLGERFFDT